MPLIAPQWGNYVSQQHRVIEEKKKYSTKEKYLSMLFRYILKYKNIAQ